MLNLLRLSFFDSLTISTRNLSIALNFFLLQLRRMLPNQGPRPLPIPPSTPSPYRPPSSEPCTTPPDPSRSGESSGVPYSTFGRHILSSISPGDENPQPHDAGPSALLLPVTPQMQKYTSANKILQDTSHSNQGYPRPVSTQSDLQYNTTDTNLNQPRPRHSSFSTVSLRITPEPHQSSSLSPPGPSQQAERGTTLKRDSSTHDLQGKYTSHPKNRSGVKIAHNKDEEAIPTSGLLWYRGPVHGALPGRTLRSHSTTTIRNKAWVIGGYDDKQSYRDIYCLDFETLQWSHPEYKGDIPPPCRGHTATAVDHRIFVIGGMSIHTTSEPITVYIFDTLTLTWMQPRIAQGSSPAQRRAHSAVYWDKKIWIFGGGNGFTALNDVWSLDVSAMIDNRRMVHGRTERLLRWESIEKQEMKPDTVCSAWPDARGYHTADVVDSFMVIIGGADGQGILDSTWVLNLETKAWYHADWLKGSSIASRLAHSSTRLGPYLFIFGGVGKEYNSELHLLNLVTLQEERRRVYGIPPMPRGYHTMVYGNGRMHVIGGANATHGFDDVWILELASLAYFPQITDFKVEPLEDIGWY